uniref:Uncharacterized protein n=1 Tax=Siphoviridae sp. ctCIv11 TaxID=2827806 RepID=A0A8S5S2D3_9CAUD|nr:MAG TPA: hypothetical protein [Siphoviridae sp. ctCIv11]DAW42748.1 MAG TPA: hypothetical protein [Caudoviricetes sp.]
MRRCSCFSALMRTFMNKIVKILLGEVLAPSLGFIILKE